jgi:hypothetical protein
MVIKAYIIVYKVKGSPSHAGDIKQMAFIGGLYNSLREIVEKAECADCEVVSVQALTSEQASSPNVPLPFNPCEASRAIRESQG